MDVPTDDPKALYDELNKRFPNKYGLGLYSWGVHVDVRENKARW